jgi:hypothetical protein
MSRNGTPVALSSLCTFIGALYSHCILPSSPIHLCFSLLLSELNAVEHVRAIHALIYNSGEKLWMGQEGGIALRDVHTGFTQRVSAMNLKGSARVEVDKYVKVGSLPRRNCIILMPLLTSGSHRYAEPMAYCEVH